MKHIKTFENNQQYKKGDYVILTDQAISLYNSNIEKICIIYENIYGGYDITVTSKDTKRPFFLLWFKNNDIERKATQEEIEEHEMMINVRNFNL